MKIRCCAPSMCQHINHAWDVLGVCSSYKQMRRSGMTRSAARDVIRGLLLVGYGAGLDEANSENAHDPLNLRRTREAYLWVAFVQNVEVAELIDLIALGRSAQQLEAAGGAG